MALTLEGSRHIPCAVSLRNADGTWNVPATLTLAKREGEVKALGTADILSQGLGDAPRRQRFVSRGVLLTEFSTKPQWLPAPANS